MMPVTSIMTSRFAAALSCVLVFGWPGASTPSGRSFAGQTGPVSMRPWIPVEFSPTKNVAWKTAVPSVSRRRSLRHRLYLTGSEGDGCSRSRRRRDGQGAVAPRGPTRTREGCYKANDPASPTPAADESGVVAFFPEFGLVAYTNDGQCCGRTAWARSRTSTAWRGPRSSPAASWSAVRPAQGSFLVALDRATGQVRWKTDRPGTRTAGRRRRVPSRRVARRSSCSARRVSTATSSGLARSAGGRRSPPAVRWVHAVAWRHADGLDRWQQ